jgi:hypothetical protein
LRFTKSPYYSNFEIFVALKGLAVAAQYEATGHGGACHETPDEANRRQNLFNGRPARKLDGRS